MLTIHKCRATATSVQSLYPAVQYRYFVLGLQSQHKAVSILPMEISLCTNKTSGEQVRLWLGSMHQLPSFALTLLVERQER